MQSSSGLSREPATPRSGWSSILPRGGVKDCQEWLGRARDADGKHRGAKPLIFVRRADAAMILVLGWHAADEFFRGLRIVRSQRRRRVGITLVLRSAQGVAG